jgi:hypothetical protein
MNTQREDEVMDTSAEARTTKKKSGKISRSVSRLLNGEFLTKEGLINHLPFIGFLVFLFLLHISLMYYFENIQRDLVKKQGELNELRSQFNSSMSELETKKQQSNVAQEIQALGLEELRVPPAIIDVEKGYFKEK